MLPNAGTASHVSLHRLSNDEYNNTVRDLLYSSSRPADAFPPSGLGNSGFSNDSDRLNVFDDLVTQYESAAQALAQEVLKSKGTAGGAYARIAACAVGVAKPTADCMQQTLRTFLARAYRRAPAVIDQMGVLQPLTAIATASTDFDAGLANAIYATLLNPHFLFVAVTSGAASDSSATFALDDDELASRLSYFLWQSMPDDELFQQAAAKKLSDPTVLASEVKRMLKDPKAATLTTSLRNDWLGLEPLTTPVLGLDDSLRASMLQETDAMLQNIVSSDTSFLDVVQGRYAFVNKQMADLYGVPFTGSDPSKPVRVDLSSTQRQGVMGSASFLTEFAGATSVTHPVIRGKAVLIRIMCQAMPPPPPGVPPLPDQSTSGLTVREALDQHAQNPFCNSCHQSLDPIGLALESFGPTGQFRTSYPGSNATIDPSGTMPDGTAFQSAGELMSKLGTSDAVRSCLVKQLMAYALTRAVDQPGDLPAIQTLAKDPVAGSFSDLVVALVSTPQFRMQQGDAQ